VVLSLDRYCDFTRITSLSTLYIL